MIKTTISRKAKGPNYWWYQLQIIEDTNSIKGHESLERCIVWADEKLKDWDNCRRTSWDIWDFKTRQDAESFAILFHLSCQ